MKLNLGTMATTIKRVTTFAFSSQVGETTYNFQIPAETEAEARNKLIAALGSVVEDLKAMQAKPMAS